MYEAVVAGVPASSRAASYPPLPEAIAGTPHRAATASAALRLTSVIATIRASGSRNATVSAWIFPIRPAPMIPIPRG